MDCTVIIYLFIRFRARETKQAQLKTCDASDPAGYVTGTLLFVRHFAEGGACHGTKGTVDGKKV